MQSSRSAVRRLAVSRGVSVAGSSAAFTALGVAVYAATGSSTWISMTLLCTFGVRGVVSFAAGTLGDRFNRRTLMITCELIGSAVFAAMVMVDQPGVLIALAFLAAVAEPPFEAAAAAAIPSLAGEERLGWANGLVGFGRNLGYTLGPVVGGALAASVGAAWVFGANAVSFAISAAVIATLRADLSKARDVTATTWKGVRRGIELLVSHPVLRVLSLADAVLVVGMALILVADLPLSTELGRGAFGYGVMYSAWGVGMVTGSLAARWLTPRAERSWVFFGAVVLTVQAVAVALTPWFWVIVILILLGGLADSLWVVSTLSIRQRVTPDHVRSRVLAASDGIIYLAFLPGFLAAGPVISWVGPRGAYIAFGCFSAVAAAVLLPVWLSRARPGAAASA